VRYTQPTNSTLTANCQSNLLLVTSRYRIKVTTTPCINFRPVLAGRPSALYGDVCTSNTKPLRNKSFYFPSWFFLHIDFNGSTYGQKAKNWVEKWGGVGGLPTRTIRRNLLYCHKQHQWHEAEVSVSGKWKAVAGLCGT
jgi:hypothetical protein